MEQVFSNHQFDTVFHCASYGMSGREQVCDLRGGRSWFKPFFRSENKDQVVCSGFQQITLILYTLDGAEVSLLQEL